VAHTIINLDGSAVESVRLDGEDSAHVRFAPAVIIKSQGIAGVDASTRWAQIAVLTIREAQVTGEVSLLPATAAGGSMECGGFKYLDMIPLPIGEVPGFAELRVRLAGGNLVVTGEDPRVALEGQAHYLEHVKETQPPR
jgi:hypothetical protein